MLPANVSGYVTSNSNSAWNIAFLSAALQYKREVHLITCHQGTQGLYVQLYSFFNLDAKCGWLVFVTPRPVYPKERHTVHIRRKVCCTLGSAWKVTKNLAPPAIRYPDRPDHTESLYPLHYAGPQHFSITPSEQSITLQELIYGVKSNWRTVFPYCDSLFNVSRKCCTT